MDSDDIKLCDKVMHSALRLIQNGNCIYKPTEQQIEILCTDSYLLDDDRLLAMIGDENRFDNIIDFTERYIQNGCRGLNIVRNRLKKLNECVKNEQYVDGLYLFDTLYEKFEC